MGQRIVIGENGIYMVMEISDTKEFSLLHLSDTPLNEDSIKEKNPSLFRAIELQTSGDSWDHMGIKRTETGCPTVLLYDSHRDYRNDIGRKLEITLTNSNLRVILHYQLYDGVSAIRTWADVENISTMDMGIEYISLFSLTGIGKEGEMNMIDKIRLLIPHNRWIDEVRWREYTLPELGFSKLQCRSSKRVSIHNTGTWSSKEHLPMGCIVDMEYGTSWLWQIEHNGSWQWELSDIGQQMLYLKLSGPNEIENHCWMNLLPGQRFTTPTAAVSVAQGFEAAVGEMTKYRRKIRRICHSDSNLPVIFNDYMNCLWADPTTEKLIPVIDAAAKAGAEIYCIDAGWHAEGSWWSDVGEWTPTERRFPGGFDKIFEYICSKNMIPGLWIEPEVMGIHCPLATEWDDTCFFMRHGKRVIDRQRYQLDYRHPFVRKYMTDVIDRLVSEYRLGYIKMDYNIDAGIGTEAGADSFGDGQLQHNRAFLLWIEEIQEKYPHLILENCASGGMRMDYAMLSRFDLQSMTDQSDYQKMAPIAAACSTAVIPEQAAIWSYPLADAEKNEVIFNMVNAMLTRIHLSGEIDKLSEHCFELVKQGVVCYKNIRHLIPSFIPFYPTGLPVFGKQWLSVGYRYKTGAFLAVWKLESDEDVFTISLPSDISAVSARCIYPVSHTDILKRDAQNPLLLEVSLTDKYSAAIIELKIQ